MVHAHETQNANGEDPADDKMASKEEATDIAEIMAGATTMNTMKNREFHHRCQDKKAQNQEKMVEIDSTKRTMTYGSKATEEDNNSSGDLMWS